MLVSEQTQLILDFQIVRIPGDPSRQNGAGFERTSSSRGGQGAFQFRRGPPEEGPAVIPTGDSATDKGGGQARNPEDQIFYFKKNNFY